MRAPLLAVALVAAVVLAACSTAAPPASPTPSAPPPSENPAEPDFTLNVTGEAAGEMLVDIYDEEGSLEAARSLTAIELAAAMPQMTDAGIVTLQAQGDEKSVILVWIGLQCDEAGDITVAEGTIDLVPTTVGDCDLLPNGRGVLLTFANPTSAADIDVSLAGRAG